VPLKRKGIRKRIWMKDDETDVCLLCKTEFTFFNRRHHCRQCLKIYCHDCSSNIYEEQRICDKCLYRINKANKAAKKKKKATPVELGEVTLKEMLHACDSNNSAWTHLYTTNDVKVYKQDLDSGTYVKGVGIIDVPVALLLTLLSDLGNKSSFDDMFKEGHHVENISENVTIIYQEFKKPFMVSARDFCNISVLDIQPNGITTIAAKSYTHPKAPERDGFVRANLMLGGYHIVPYEYTPSPDEKPFDVLTKSKRCVLTFVAKINLGGSLPSTILKAVAKDQPMQVAKIRSVVEKMKLNETDYEDRLIPLIQGYFTKKYVEEKSK
jgi:hypothetical protein